MNSREGIIGRLDDWLNPIVVKELRQAVQGKFVSAALLLLLAVQLITLGIYIVSNGDFTEKYDAGRTAFMFLLAILLAICLIFVPAYTAIRLAVERDTNVDLMFVTTIKPSAIVWGKMFAALTITMMAFSACLPFMVFTYWLRGIDIPSIFILMTVAFLMVAFAVQLATFVACIQAGRVLKILLSLLVFLFFPQAFIALLSWSYFALIRGVGSKLATWEFWGPASAVLLISGAAIGLLFSLSVAMIKPQSSNRAFPVRLFATCLWLITGIVSTVIGYVERDSTPLSMWSILSVIIFGIGFFVAVSEREELGVRFTRKIPEGPLRLPAFFLFSGGANGVAWCALMSLATFVAVQFLTISSTTLRTAGSMTDSQAWTAGLALYALAYSMAALFIRRRLLSRWVRPRLTWLLGFLLLVAGSLLPFLLGYLIEFGNYKKADDIGGWLITNPFALGLDSYRNIYITFAAACSLIGVLINADWFIEQIKAFRPRGEEPAMVSLSLNK